MSQNSYYQLGQYQEFITSELRALTLPTYHDPLVLCFKVIFDYSKPYGLFADESNTDSALAYLTRLGDTARHDMLARWISVWKTFWSQYDFLVQQVDGLNVVENFPPQDNFNGDNDKIVFQIRETSDMMFTGLLATYRQIWHDDTRVVEVLPANLRRFDMSVLVFNGSYFNMDLYDIPAGSTINTDNIPVNQIQQLVFPTHRKLSDQQFSLDGTGKQFNHMLYKFGDCNINFLDSGSQFASSIVNEQSSSMLMQNLSLNFRFGNYSGRFNNIMGNVDFSALLAMLSAQNRVASLGSQGAASDTSLLDNLGKQLGQQAANTLQQSINIAKNNFTSNNTFIGNLINSFTSENATSLLSNTFQTGLNFLQNALVIDPLTKLSNILVNNFGAITNLGLRTQGTTLMTPQKAQDLPVSVPYIPVINGPLPKAVRYGEYNALANFNRRGF
jgi:hypothetical protein